jgi:trk system potassium uptake protein TrkA
MAIKAARELMMPNMMDFIPLSEDYEIVEIAPSSGYIGKSLLDLQFPNRYGVQVVAIKELIPEKFTIAPKADFVVKDSDILVILGRKEDILKLKEN